MEFFIIIQYQKGRFFKRIRKNNIERTSICMKSYNNKIKSLQNCYIMALKKFLTKDMGGCIICENFLKLRG